LPTVRPVRTGALGPTASAPSETFRIAFAPNDKIQLDGVVANKDSFSPSSVLSLLNGNKTVATLKFAGSYNPLGFKLSEVGGATAVVTYSGAAAAIGVGAAVSVSSNRPPTRRSRPPGRSMTR
jgi:hypothetical protein